MAKPWDGFLSHCKRRCTRLKKVISSLPCLPPTMSTPSSLKSSIMERHLQMKQCNRSRGPPSIWPTSYMLPPTSKDPWWQTQKKKRPLKELQSSDKLSKSFKGTTKQGTAPPMSSIPHHGQSKGSCSWMDVPPSKTSYKEWSLSMKMVSPPIPSACQQQCPTLNPFLSPTLTSSCLHEPAHHI